jgi:DNA-binding HxlR family transcriptional regulator
MGIFNFFRKKNTTELRDFELPSVQELQAIKDEIANQKNSPQEPKNSDFGPENTKKIIFPEHSDNPNTIMTSGQTATETQPVQAVKQEKPASEIFLDTAKDKAKDLQENEAVKTEKNSNKIINFERKDDENIEMKLIKMLNELDSLKARLDQYKIDILNDMKNIHSEIGTLSELVRNVPKEAGEELRNIKRNHPEVYREMRQTVDETIKKFSIDEMEASIMRLIKDAGKISSLDLVERARACQTCSKNTLYIRLRRLEERGMIAKKRFNHVVMYSLTEAGLKEIEAPEKEKKQEEAPKEAAITSALSETKKILTIEDVKSEVRTQAPATNIITASEVKAAAQAENNQAPEKKEQVVQ